jgi:hypothetical protein
MEGRLERRHFQREPAQEPLVLIDVPRFYHCAFRLVDVGDEALRQRRPKLDPGRRGGG